MIEPSRQHKARASAKTRVEAKPTRGRPKLKESPSRGFIVKAGKQLFLANGYKNTSVEAICAKAGTSKMTFYRHFRDKLHLVFIILNEFLDKELEWFEELLAKDIEFEAKLNAMMAKRQRNLKSPEVKLMGEVADIQTPEAKAFWPKLRARIDASNLRVFEQGKEQGAIAAQMTPELFLYFLKKRNELFFDPELAKICPTKEQRLKVIDNFFYQGFRRFS